MRKFKSKVQLFGKMFLFFSLAAVLSFVVYGLVKVTPRLPLPTVPVWLLPHSESWQWCYLPVCLQSKCFCGALESSRQITPQGTWGHVFHTCNSQCQDEHTGKEQDRNVWGWGWFALNVGTIFLFSEQHGPLLGNHKELKIKSSY